jgi:hypothetical protein
MENMKCHSSQNGRPPKTLRNIVIAVFVVGGGYYLWMQHRAHVLQYLPFAFFLLCPLMHLFGHGAHGGHGGHDDSSEKSDSSDHAGCHHQKNQKQEG